MRRREARAGSRRIRVAVAAGALVAAAFAGTLVAAAPAVAAPAATPKATSPSTPGPTSSPVATPHPTGAALAVDLAAGTVLTLPAKDGLRDSTTVRIFSGRSGLVDLDAVRGKQTVHLGEHLSLTSTSTGWSRSVRVDVQRLTAGTWRLRAQRSTDHSVQARSRALPVGTGAAVHVGVRPAARTLYPYKDGTLDAALVTITAEDETSTPVPVTGTVRIDAAKKHVTRAVGSTGVAQLPITALPIGAATITATVTGPSGGEAVRHTGLTLAATGVGSLRIARSTDTVAPVRDGLLDSVVLTTSGSASARSAARVSGSLVVARGKAIAAIFAVKDGGPRQFTWDGRVNHIVKPGTYTVTLSLRGPQGAARTTSTQLVVTRTHLPYRVKTLFTVAAGNQQGLAVHDGTFYVGYDNGDGTSRIDEYSGSSGALTRSLGPLSIGHAAELSYSTSTGLLYAANGGPNTPTFVWSIDPATGAVHDTFDLSSLGPNGMVAVDDAASRLLVFTGTSAGGYFVTPVGLTPATGTDPATGAPTSAPSIGTSRPIAITGTPQGMDIVSQQQQQQLWVYTSLKKVNHLAKYDVSTMLAATGADSSSDLVFSGEGEGLAYQAAAPGQDTGTTLPGWMYVGAHAPLRGGPNLLGQLIPVTAAD